MGNYVSILSNDDVVNYNPFKITDSDVDEANNKTKIIDESDDKDDFMVLG